MANGRASFVITTLLCPPFRFSQCLSNVSGHFFLGQKIIETGPSMLYMVGKIFLSGVSFDIVYNESVNEDMKKLEKLFFSHRV